MSIAIEERLTCIGYTFDCSVTSIATRGWFEYDEEENMRYYNVLRKLNPLDNKLFSDANCNYHKDLVIKGDYFDNFQLLVDDLLKEFFPDTATEDGYLPAWEELTDSKRFYKADKIYTEAEKQKIVTAIFISQGKFNREAIENIFKCFDYTISYTSGTDNVDGSTVRLEEGETLAFRADFGRCDLDAIYDYDTGNTVRILTYHVQDNDILAIIDTVKCFGVTFIWEVLT